MKQELKLIAAPPAMQPGGYIATAYKERLNPSTPTATLEAIQQDDQWVITVRWPCPKPVSDIRHDTNLFTDAAAIMVPTTANSAWITMGDPKNPIEAVLWRATKGALTKVDAKGFGSTIRSNAPENWTAKSKWEEGYWTIEFSLKDWDPLNTQKRIALAIWRGSDQDRGGLKSVTSDWIAI